MPKGSSDLDLAQQIYNYVTDTRNLAGPALADGAFEEMPGIKFIDSMLKRFGPIWSQDSAEQFLTEMRENTELMLETERAITIELQESGHFEAELGAHQLKTDPDVVVDQLINDTEFINERQFLDETRRIFSSDVADPRRMWSLHEASSNRVTKEYVKGAVQKIASNTSAGGQAKAENAIATVEKNFIKECWQDWVDGKTNYKNQEKFIDDMSQKVEVLKCNSTTINGWIREWMGERS